MSNIVRVDTTKLQVLSVCVFQADRADVQRVVAVELEAGQNEIIIENLPNSIDKDSIRVEGLGDAVIFDVVYHPPPTHKRPAVESPQQQALNQTQKTLAQVRAQKATLEGQQRILSNYGKSLEAKKNDATAVSKFLTLHSEKRREIFAESQALEDELVATEEQDKRLRKEFNSDDNARKRQVKVTVVVFANVAGRVELSLHYLVSGASWKPLYDLRANITSAGKDQEPSVSLQYRASITQRTAEDWNEVALTLSTASPQLGATIPSLSTYRIGKPMPIAMQYGYFSACKMATSPALARSSPSMARKPRARKIIDSIPQITHLEAVAVEGATSSTFVVAGNSTIPSDDTWRASTHKVSIAIIDLKAKLEWIAVPKVQAAAFLRCKIKNTSQYLLLPGPSSVFMDGNFVCKSAIGAVSPQETFSTSLGIDPAVRITYHNLQKRTKSSQGGLLGSKFDVTSFTQRVTVKNTRAGKVSPLFVKDQVPISEDSEFRIDVTKPAQLGVPKDRLEAQVGPGVKARWSFKDVEEGNEGTEEDGVVEWVCDIAAGKSTDLTLAWDVIAPVGRAWAHR